jgi:hypothetical protein
MNDYFPAGQKNIDNLEDEVWDYACQRYGTPDPSLAQLQLANQEITDAWEDYEKGF